MNAPRGRLRRAVPLAIVAVALVPVILAALIYFRPGWFALGHSNHGRLVAPPITMQVPSLPRVFAHAPLAQDYLRGEWTIVYVGEPDCDAVCRETLYVTRQIRRGMGRDIRRVQRLYIVRGDHLNGAQRIHVTHPDLTVVTAAGTAGRAFAAQFSATTDVTSIYLVDPNGLLMMTYPVTAKPLGFIKDLRKLLKTNPP